MTAPKGDAGAADRTLVTTRTFAAPRELVWKAWTDPKQLARWFPPDHFTAPVCEADVRPGGTLRITMQGPDGTRYPATGTYRDVVPNERLAFTLEGEDGGVPPEVLMTVDFADEGSATRVTIHQTMQTAAIYQGMAKNMSEGLRQSLDKLAGLIGAAGGTTTSVSGRTLTLRRTFDAPRELVFKAYTDPTHIVQWMFADDWETPFAETDLRPGGAFRIGMRPADHSHEGFVLDGAYREVVAPERLVQELGDGRLLTTTFEDLGGTTRLTLAVEMAMSAEQERAGYTQILAHFARHVATLAP